MTTLTPSLTPDEQSELIALAHRLADAAREVTLAHFRQPDVVASSKEVEQFDPVTIADRDAEAAMRAILAHERPRDGIYGEEHGIKEGTSGLTWVLDPIDGTRGFISGTPTWGVLIGLRSDTDVLLGVIDQPYIGERFIGGFGHAHVDGPQGAATLATREISELSEATIFTTFPEVGTENDRAGFEAVARQCRLTRYGMDCYAYALLSAGQIDLVIEAGLQPYDIMGPIGVIEAAGGIITNWSGGPALAGGQVVAAGCKQAHDLALAALAPFAAP